MTAFSVAETHSDNDDIYICNDHCSTRMCRCHQRHRYSHCFVWFADERAVQDLERRAALMHFSSEQVAEMTDRRSWTTASAHQMNPRVAHVQTLAKLPSCWFF